MEKEMTDAMTYDSEMVDKISVVDETKENEHKNEDVKVGRDDQDSDSGKANGDEVTVAKKKRGRRRRPKGGGRHHWKPYDQLNWVQRRKLEERETKRATKKREAAFEHGHPVAPYNTTQFLIEDHLQNGQSMSPDLELKIHVTENHDDKSIDWDSESEPSIDELNDSPTNEIFLAKDFTEAYTNIHAERLQNMSKSELIKEYLVLESKTELLEERVKNLTGHNMNNLDNYTESEHLSIAPSTKVLLDEIDRLQKENRCLRAETSMKDG